MLFLGDCLSQRLYAPEPHLTIDGTRAVAERVEAFDAAVVIRGHGPGELMDAAAHTADIAALRGAADRVERLGAAALETASDDDDRETLEFFVTGLAYTPAR